MEEKLELVSLPGRGRAEVVRLMLVLTKTPFVDHRVTLPQWIEFRKREQLPADTKLPLLRINDRRTIVGGAEIGRYVAEKVGLYGDNDGDAQSIERVIAEVEFLQPNLAPVIRASLAKNFHERKSTWHAYKENTLAPSLERLTARLGLRTFFVGDRLSWADVAVAETLSRFTHLFDANFIHNHPVLKAHMMAVERVPELRRYLAERPNSLF